MAEQMMQETAGKAIPAGYQQTEVGVIPEDWEQVALGDIAEVRMCKRIFSDQTTESGEIPFFKIGTFGGQPDAYISISRYNEFKSKYSFPEKGDVLISAAGTLGKTVVYDGEPAYFQDSNIVWLEIDKNKIINEYLHHYYKVISWASPEGSTISRLYNGIIRATVINLPSLPEQTAIANVLSDSDALIDALEQLIAKKQAIKSATMQQLLTGRTRLPAFALRPDGTPKGYKPSELGDIPEDWVLADIRSISAVPMQNGLFYEPMRKGKGVPLINVGDMYTAAPVDVGLLELFDASLNEIKLFKAVRGDLFFTRSSVVPSGIAYCNIFDSERNDVVFDSHLIRVRPNVELVDPKYLYLSCISKYARSALVAEAKTATMTTIDQGAINRCPVLVPPKNEQTAIATILSDMDNELQALTQKLEKARALKQGMMQQLLTGKTRLPLAAGA